MNPLPDPLVLDRYREHKAKLNDPTLWPADMPMDQRALLLMESEGLILPSVVENMIKRAEAKRDQQ